MNKNLQVDLNDLLYCRGVESERVEFKASWNPRVTGPKVLRTVCAFANDYHNLNGGFVVIGIEKRNGRIVLPPRGLSPKALDADQRWTRDQCNRISPSYQPILSPETVSNRCILVVWAPASDGRPHLAPSYNKRPGRYWVRLGSETVDAEQRGGILGELIQQTARVPWDDRRALGARVEDLSKSKVREYLRDFRSEILDEPSTKDIYRRLRLTTQVNGHEVPRNGALLTFSRDPSRWFPGDKIEVVQFAADGAGDIHEKRTFDGSLVDQLRDCLSYVENFSAFQLQEHRHKSQIGGSVSYPLPAFREALVNALCHRGYDTDQPEPTSVHLHPGRIVLKSYPGPVAAIEHAHMTSNDRIPAAPVRNRRICDFLKEIGLAGGTYSGLAKIFRAMDENGSPVPSFEFDEQRTYFRATLPVHPNYSSLAAASDVAFESASLAR